MLWEEALRETLESFEGSGKMVIVVRQAFQLQVVVVVVVVVVVGGGGGGDWVICNLIESLPICI